MKLISTSFVHNPKDWIIRCERPDAAIIHLNGLRTDIGRFVYDANEDDFKLRKKLPHTASSP